MRFASLIVCVLAIASNETRAETPPTVDFARDVRPILADFCIRCHGPDAKQRQAGVQFDSRDEATRAAKSGHRPIVPGKPEASEIVRRIFAEDDDVMPPKETQQSLKPAQKETLKRWIVEGAKFQTHWAFVVPTRPVLQNLKSQISDLKSKAW